MRWLLLYLLLFSHTAIAGVVEDLEQALLNNEIKRARECIVEIRETNSWSAQTAKDHVGSYINLVDTFEAVNKFEVSATNYLNTQDEREYLAAVSQATVVSNLYGNYKHYRISQAVIDKLNAARGAANDLGAQIDNVHKQELQRAAEKKRLADEQKIQAEAAARAQRDEEYRRMQIEDEEYERKANAESARRSKLCGKDFKQFRIGMSKKRFLLCNPARLYAERADGIELYNTADGTLVTISKGKVYSWIR